MNQPDIPEVAQTAENLPDIATNSDQLDWKRAHPLSPLVRVWLIFIALCIFSGREGIERWVENDWKLPESPNSYLSFLGTFALPATFILFFIIALIPNIWSWYTTRFALDEHKVYLRRGAIFRSFTEARLDKVQAIDIYQPFVARLLGLAELKFEVADGSKSLLAVQFLKKKDAENLRAALLRQVQVLKNPASVVASEGSEQDAAVPAENGGEAPAGQPAVPAVSDAETPIFQVPAGRNLAAVLMGSGLIPIVLAAGTFVIIGLIFGEEISITGIIGSAGVLGILASIWGALNAGHRFRASATESALKLRYGLTSTTSQTVPLGRIQNITVTQPFFWRFLGWFKVTATIAGYGVNPGDDSSNTRDTLLPVGTGQELLDLMPYLIKDHEQGRIDGRQLQAALEGKGDHFGFTLNPPSTRWVNWFTWKRNGFALTPAYLLVRSGFFVRRLRVIPLDKVQSTQVIEGPLDRKLGVAQVDMGVAAGKISLGNRIENVSAENARYLAGLLVRS